MDLTCGNACYSEVIELENSSVLVQGLANDEKKVLHYRNVILKEGFN